MNNNTSKLLKGSKLRNRFLVLFVILITVPILILGAGSLYLVDLAHRQDVSTLELQLIDQKIEEIGEFLARNTEIDLVVNIDYSEGGGIISFPNEDQLFILRGSLEANPALAEASFVNLAGFVTSRMISGRVSEESASGNISSHPGFDIARRGEKYIGEVYYKNSEPYVTIASPVREKDNFSGKIGDVVYIIFAEANISELARSIKIAGLGNSGYLILVDKNKKVIAAGGGSQLSSGDDISNVERVREVLSGTTFNALGDNDRYSSLFNNISVIGAAKKVTKTGWALLVEWPISDADSVLKDIRNKVIQFTLFSVIAVLVIAIFFAARLVRPIKKLQMAAREIEQGKFETRVDIKTNDELEELGDVFNKMTVGLKRLQELRDEFVFVAAHELRTPVTAIKGYISLILEGSAGDMSEQVKNFLEQTQKSNDLLNKLVNDLLEIARSEAGRLEISVAPVDVEEPAKNVVEELKPLADEKQISLTYTHLKVVPKVMGDAVRVKEVMINLVGNAIKYTQNGGGIEIYNEQKDGMLITHIRDNGFGISHEAQKNLFEKFYRVQNEKTKNIQGTGLGLFIVRQIIEKMGGKIWVTSEEGRGSTFSFSLPLAGAYDA